MPKPVPTLTRRAKQARGRARIDQIIAAGMYLMKNRRFEDLTMEQIAERAGCSVGTIYKHFANKDALLEVLAESVRREILQEFDGAAQIGWLRGDSLDEIVHRMVRTAVSTVRERRELVRALLLRRLQAPDSMRPLQQANMLVVAAAIERSAPYRPAHLDAATFERRYRITYQMMIGTLVNILVSQPGPLHLDDDDLDEQLALPMLAYLTAP